MKRGTRTTARPIFPTMKRNRSGEPCALSIPPRASSSGNGSIPRRRGLECFPRQGGWGLRETRKETSLRSKRLQGKGCGTSSAARRFLHRPCRLRLTANNTWRFGRGGGGFVFGLSCGGRGGGRGESFF